MSFEPRFLELAAAAYTATPTFQYGDVHVVLTEESNFTVVAFRGTVPDNMSDWLRDFEAWPIWRPRLGFCHAGFLEGAEAIWPQLSPALEGKRVVLTGHSLGGALAIALAGLMVRGGHLPIVLRTYGAPRVGFVQLTDLLSPIRNIRQYRNGNDPVPEAPPLFDNIQNPLFAIGQPTFNPIDSHEISAYAKSLAGT